ncbi:secretion protein HlyD [Alsobacter metallidurans]|uniref:Secretion protein HlyD n=1 Tax=Alsobacter metallidurans TaxID=340221 RepID=A0A917I4V1_9HYPH|nr:HlyD family efflux transporter periplasmic adaptor subunit [Alsobacter metallidurans]GGH09085.1 secretion protein HlyD [Alsobacter metallidurans]
MKASPIFAAFALAAAAAGGLYWTLTREPEAPAGWQGYVEGQLVYLAAEEGGRIETLKVEAGDEVAQGQPIFALEASSQDAQLAEAQARALQARAQLENLQAALQRPEQVAVLRAQEERARATLDLSRSEFERQQALYGRGISAKARLDQAESTFERDKAALEEAQRQILAAQLSARTGDIAGAEAFVRAAEAAVRQAEARVAKRRVASPAAGRVQDVFFRAGEVVNPGQPVLSLLPPANLKVRFYVPEPALSRLSLGQTVHVGCDSCPEGLTATLSFLSREAEYTPPVIFSEQERGKLVFRAEARLAGEGLKLPLGLPVSVEPAEARP